MKRIVSLLLTVFLCLTTFTATACAKEQETETTVLRICNCEDYIDETLLDDFTEQTGIEVIYSTYGTNENLYNELVINPNSYDLVVPSEYMIENLAVEGRIKKLDLTKVPNYTENVSGYINERLKDKTFTVKDGEYKGQESSISEYMVGYMWGTMGWVYNTENVAESDVSSWINPFNNPNLSKKITIKDAIRDSYLVGLAMVYGDELKNADTNEKITEILNRTEQENIDAVGEKLEEIRPMLYGFEVDSGKNDIVLGNIDAYVAWSGDAAYAIDVAAGEAEDEDGSIVENTRDLSYYIPDEGSNIWFDGFCMPSGSTNDDAVYKFLNFISSPDSVYRNMDYTGYTSMVGGDEIFENIVLEWFDYSEDEDYTEDDLVAVDLSYFFGEGDYTVYTIKDGYGRLMAQYPTLEIANRCAIMSYFDSDTLLSVNDMWESVKGETFQTWLIIVIAVAVVLLMALIVLLRNKEKFPWLKLPERKTTYAQRKNLTVVKVEEINEYKKIK